jgi:hypothetical protein
MTHGNMRLKKIVGEIEVCTLIALREKYGNEQ